MVKVQHIFKRDEKGLYVPEITPGCEWVLEGTGYVSLKLDGICVKIDCGKFYRREKKHYLTSTDGAPVEKQEYVVWKEIFNTDPDEENKVLVKTFNEDRWKVPGIYEVIGPGIKGNPHQVKDTQLVKTFPLDAKIIIYTTVHKIQRGPNTSVQRMFDSMVEELMDVNCDVEGVVIQKEEWSGGVSTCKMAAQVTKVGFGLEWPPKPSVPAVTQATTDPIEVKSTEEISTGTHFKQFDMNNRMW